MHKLLNTIHTTTADSATILPVIVLAHQSESGVTCFDGAAIDRVRVVRRFLLEQRSAERIKSNRRIILSETVQIP
jgi:hypothetical protein